MDTVCSGPKSKWRIQTVVSNQSLQPGSVMVWGCISALGKAHFHFCDGINAEKFTEILQQHMLPSRPHLFQGRPCIFQPDNVKPHSAHIPKTWLRKKRVRVLACLQFHAIPTFPFLGCRESVCILFCVSIMCGDRFYVQPYSKFLCDSLTSG